MTDNSADNRDPAAAQRAGTPDGIHVDGRPVRTPAASNGSSGRDVEAELVRLDEALEQVIAAARAHLAAVKAAQGERDDDGVWHAYVALNNSSHQYDKRLNDVFGEVTPWDLETISPDEIDRYATVTTPESPDQVHDDAYPQVVSVRQRRDYRVPSVAALLRSAMDGRPPAAEGEVLEPIETVAEAMLELLQSGDGSMAMLDVPELEPLDGVVVVAEVAAALSTEEFEGPAAAGAFDLTGADRAVGRLDERTLLDLDD